TRTGSGRVRTPRRMVLWWRRPIRGSCDRRPTRLPTDSLLALKGHNLMSVSLNGIAHIQLTVNDPARCLPFWDKLCHFFEMQTLIQNETPLCGIGSRTGISVRSAPAGRNGGTFDQLRAGLHHFCLRARSREDVDAVARFAAEIGAKIVHPAEEGAQ